MRPKKNLEDLVWAVTCLYYRSKFENCLKPGSYRDELSRNVALLSKSIRSNSSNTSDHFKKLFFTLVKISVAIGRVKEDFFLEDVVNELFYEFVESSHEALLSDLYDSDCYASTVEDLCDAYGRGRNVMWLTRVSDADIEVDTRFVIVAEKVLKEYLKVVKIKSPPDRRKLIPNIVQSLREDVIRRGE